MIRVLVRASSAVAQAGLEALLGAHSSVQVVRTARGNERASAESEDHAAGDPAADIVVAEIEDQEDELQREILNRASAGIPVVMLAHETAAEWIGEMLRAGVRAILPANVSGAEILAAIEAALAGLIVLHPGDVDGLAQTSSPLSGAALPSMSEPLTSRESEVLQFLARGLANKEIAGRLQISEHTVKFHVASIMGKLGAASRTEAVTLGIRRGLVMI